MSSIKENSVVYYRDDRSKHPYLVHEVLDDNVILGLKEFPEIEQDWEVSKELISLFETQEEEELARELIDKLLN